MDRTPAPDSTPRLGEAHIVSQAPASLRDWGPWQFPRIERLADGRLHLWFHVAADSALAYGTPPRHAVSSDRGATWTEVDDYPEGSGLELASGDRIRIHAEASVPADGLALGDPVGSMVNYGHPVRYYDARQIPSEQAGWFLLRSAEGGPFRREQVEMSIPGATRHVVEGVLPRPFFHRIRRGPDSSLWAPHYFPRIVGGRLQAYWSATFLTSDDGGHSWRFISEIPYEPDRQRALADDLLGRERIGFSEPDIVFVDASRCLALLRTTDGNGVGPSYLSVSGDGGRTWQDPWLFDDVGVWPILTMLGNGTVLASYGRPGLYVRTLSAQAIAEERFEPEHWGEPVPVVPPGALQTETCSYSDLLALDDDTAMIAYSDFNVPDDEGQPRKSIMVREVSIT